MSLLTSEVLVMLASLREQIQAVVANLAQGQLLTYKEKIRGIVAKVNTIMRDKQERKLSILGGTSKSNQCGTTKNWSEEGNFGGVSEQRY